MRGGGKGALIQDDVSATLSTANAQTIFQPIGFAYNAGGKAASCAAAEEIAPTLRAASNGENGVCYSIAGNIINRKANNGGNGNGFNEEVSYTLNTIDRHAVCFQQNQRDEVRLMGGDGSVAGAISAAPGMKNTNYLCVADDNAKAAVDEDVCGTLKVGGVALDCLSETTGALCARDSKGVGTQYVQEGKVVVQMEDRHYIVRRLTPLECERLQGFPDGWTDIEVDRKQASDAARYKALGNSMAVPVMRWIGERIERIDNEETTA